jgi:Uncharacterized protein conserved in bacteria
MALAVGLACSAVSALAQQYPTRPIRFVQGFAAGGNADVITRVLGAEMSKSLGQPVIFDARVGAGGNIAAEQVARAEPDGYTLLLVTTAHLVSPALYNSLGYDSINDFAFISSVTNVPFFIVTHAESPYKTIKDFVDAAKAKPGTLTIGTAGVGTGQHMGMELFAAATGIKVLHVPFRGDSAAVTGLLGKTVDAIVTPGTVVFGNIQGGNFRALAITSSERWPALKDVPTVAETVSPGFEMIAGSASAPPRRTETHHRAAEPGHPHSHRVAERPGAIAQSRRLSEEQHTRRGDRAREKGDSAVEGPGGKGRNSQTIAPAIRVRLFSAHRRYNRTP